MVNFWEKVKGTVEQGVESVKESTENVVKTVGERGPQVASSLAEKSREIATSVGDKTHVLVTLGQLKLKHYNLNRDVSGRFTALGDKVYTLLKENDKKVYTNPDVIKILDEVKKLEIQINKVEKELETTKEPKGKAEQREMKKQSTANKSPRQK